MFCTNCGTPITPGKAFCRQCGAPVNAEQAQQTVMPQQTNIPQQTVMPPTQGVLPGGQWQPQQSTYTPNQYQQPAAYPPGGYQSSPYAAPPPRKRANKLVFILVPALIAVVAAVLFIFVIDLRSPEQRVRDAISNTSEAIEAEQLATEKALGVTKIMELMHGNKARLDYTINVALPEDAAQSGISIPGPDGQPLPLDSASVSGSIYMDLANGAMDLDLGLGLGGTPLINLRLDSRDELMAISSVDLFEGSYGFYQDTFGQDYEGSMFKEMAGGGGHPIDSETSFNIVQTLLDLTEPTSAGASRFYSEKTESALEALEDVLWAAATVEELEDEEVSVNGAKQSCKVYHVVYERPAFIDYLYAYVDTILSDEELDFGMIGTMATMSGAPVPVGDDFEDFLYSALESFEQAVSENIEVTFFIKNDRLMRMDALLFGGEGGADETGLSVEFGDDKAVSNAMAFSASQNGTELIRLELSGDQVLNNGVYSRYVNVFEAGEQQAAIELWYDTKDDLDNFTFAAFQNGEAAVELGGSLQINTNNNTLDADITQIVMSGAGFVPETVQIGIRPDDGHSFEILSPTMLFELDEAEMQALMQEIMTNASESFGGMLGGY